MSSQGTKERVGGKMCGGQLWKANAESPRSEGLVRSSGQHLKEVPIFPLLQCLWNCPRRCACTTLFLIPTSGWMRMKGLCLRVLVTVQHLKQLVSNQTSQQACLKLKGAQLPQERMSCATNLFQSDAVWCHSLKRTREPLVLCSVSGRTSLEGRWTAVMRLGNTIRRS